MLLLLLTMPFFIKLISNRSGDPSLHCEACEADSEAAEEADAELETNVRNPDELAEYHQGN